MIWEKSNRFNKVQDQSRPFTDQADVVAAISACEGRAPAPKWVDDWKQPLSSVQPKPPPSKPSQSTSRHRLFAHERHDEEFGDLTAATHRQAPLQPQSPTKPLSPPGPATYYPERAPHLQQHKGAVSFAPSGVEIKKALFPVLPVPGPAKYLVHDSLVRPSFNRLLNAEEKSLANKAKKGKRSSDEVDIIVQIAKPAIVLEFERLSDGPKSTSMDRQQLRNAMKRELQSLSNIEIALG
jgi:hypothetical protein